MYDHQLRGYWKAIPTWPQKNKRLVECLILKWLDCDL